MTCVAEASSNDRVRIGTEEGYGVRLKRGEGLKRQVDQTAIIIDDAVGIQDCGCPRGTAAGIRERSRKDRLIFGDALGGGGPKLLSRLRVRGLQKTAGLEVAEPGKTVQHRLRRGRFSDAGDAKDDEGRSWAHALR